jgi:hypothetical protein
VFAMIGIGGLLGDLNFPTSTSTISLLIAFVLLIISYIIRGKMKRRTE